MIKAFCSIIMHRMDNVTVMASLIAGISSWAYYHNLTANHVQISNDLLHAFAGSAASALSVTLLYPLETVRTRLQVDSSRSGSSLHILYEIATDTNQGIPSLYQGLHSLVLALVCLNFVYFYCFRATRRWLEDHAVILGLGLDSVTDDVSTQHRVAIDLIAGYMAGVLGVLLTAPLWLINTRLKLQGLKSKSKDTAQENKQYDGIVHCIYTVAKEEGISSLYNGTIASIVLALNPAIQLGVYELLKRSNSLGGKAFRPFVNALLAKFLATMITYPIQVLQTRDRAAIASVHTKQQRSRWIHELQTMMQHHGVRGLYHGLEAKLLQTLLNSGFMFLFYEHLVDFFSTIFSTS